MRVGFLTSDLHHGHGWGHYSLSLIHAFRRLNVEVTVVASRNSPTNFDFPVYPVLPNVAPSEPRQLAKLTLAIHQTRQRLADCDVIHCTLEPYAPLAMWLNKPYVITGHGSYAQAGIDRNPAVRQIHKLAFRKAKSVICVSNYTAQRANAYTSGIRTEVVNNGIDPNRFTNLPALPQSVTRPTVLTAGGVKERKGTLPLVEALAVVRERIPDVQCVIIGRNDPQQPYTQRVQQAIKTHNLQDRVQLLGFVPEKTLLGWYNAADVFVLPSINVDWKFEGYGLVHMEASAAKLPVIGTRDCGAEDAIDDGITGLLVSQVNITEELPQAIIRLLTDQSLATKMAGSGYQKAQQYTWDAAAQKILAIYQSIL